MQLGQQDMLSLRPAYTLLGMSINDRLQESEKSTVIQQTKPKESRTKFYLTQYLPTCPQPHNMAGRHKIQSYHHSDAFPLGS